MSNNPVNLGVRFILELIALIAIGIWGWNLTTGVLGYLLAIGLPVLAAVVWGVFRVPGDASASGDAPVPVPGFVRLLIELSLFALAIWGLGQVGQSNFAFVLGAVVVVHYAISYDRIAWLLRQ
jgi:hypothetical protein